MASTADEYRRRASTKPKVSAKTDVALLKVDGRNDFPYVKFADGAPRVGDTETRLCVFCGVPSDPTKRKSPAHGRG